MSDSLVSIIIPAYNSEAWVGAAIESVLNQSWANKEIIIINDGSTDQTCAIVSKYLSDTVRLLNQKNRGVSAARNAGLKMAKGDYIQFLDADDLLSPEKIQAQVELLSEGQTANMIATCRWARFRSDPAKARFVASPICRNLDAEEFFDIVARTNSHYPPCSWLVPASLVARCGEFMPELCFAEDFEYFTRLVLASDGISFCNQGHVYYRSFHAKSLTKQRGSAVAQSLLVSTQQVEKNVLRAMPTDRMKLACANLYQRLVYHLYPGNPDVVGMAEARVRELGGANISPQSNMGWRGAFLTKIIGWKMTQRIRAVMWSFGIYPGKDAVISE